MTDHRQASSDLRCQIVRLRQERAHLENSLFRPKRMIRASLVLIPNVCGKKKCRCKRGEPHGPYPYLSERKGGKTRMTYVKQADLPEVQKRAAEYLRFQQGLARLTKINRTVRSLLEALWDLNCQNVDEYRRG